MPLGYGAPDLYGQDLTSMPNRLKRKNKPQNNPTVRPTQPVKNLVKPMYEVTTYKPQFVIPNFDHLHNSASGKNTKYESLL